MLATPDAELSCHPSAPADVVVRLGVEIGVPVAVRRRLSLVDDQPVALCHSYYAADLVRGTAIARPRLIRGGALRVIEDPSGPVRRAVDGLTSRTPPPEVDQLRLPPGAPVIRVLRTVYDGSGGAVEVQDTVASSDRHAFRHEVDR